MYNHSFSENQRLCKLCLLENKKMKEQKGYCKSYIPNFDTCTIHTAIAYSAICNKCADPLSSVRPYSLDGQEIRKCKICNSIFKAFRIIPPAKN